MADSQGLSPGDTGYDPSTDPYWGIAYGGGSQFSQNVESPGSVASIAAGGNPFTPVSGVSTLDQTGITNTPPTTGFGGGTGTEQQLLSYLLSQNINNPQAAIDQFNQLKPGNQWGLVYDPSRGKGIIEVNSASGAPGSYLTAPGTANGQSDWSWGPLNAPETGGNGFSIDPSYLAPFTEQFVAPGDASNPASAYSALNPKAFVLPTEKDLFASPGYQGAQDAVTKAVINSNAAKGLVNSGGNIYDLANATAGLEGQQYNDLVNNTANAYGINAGQAQNAFNNAWQQYLNRENVFYQNQNNPFSKLYQLAGLGYGAAANAG